MQKAKYRQKMTSGRHMGLTKHHSYPTRSFYSRAHRAETRADVFQALPRQISGYECLAVTHSGGSSPVCPLKHAIFDPTQFSRANPLAKVKLSLPGWALRPLAPRVTVGKGPSAKPISLSAHHKNRQGRSSGKTFLAQTARVGFFPIRQFGAMGG